MWKTGPLSLLYKALIRIYPCGKNVESVQAFPQEAGWRKSSPRRSKVLHGYSPGFSTDIGEVFHRDPHKAAMEKLIILDGVDDFIVLQYYN